jgi:hypothetical protein
MHHGVVHRRYADKRAHHGRDLLEIGVLHRAAIEQFNQPFNRRESLFNV